MADPQPGIFAEGLIAHHHLELDVRGDLPIAAVLTAISDARRAAVWLGGPNVTWGFGPSFWRKFAADSIPNDVLDFAPVGGVGGSYAPATQHDIWAWCSSFNSADVALAARRIAAILEPVAEAKVDLAAFKAPDSRDPIGFIDGTENPLSDEAIEVSLYPSGSVGEGGTAACIQKYVHNMPAFNSLTIGEQDDVIGRTKADSIQLPDPQMPATSHVSRNTVVGDDGQERHIYRRNTPYSDAGQTGTQFIGLTNDPSLMNLMLDRMFGAAGDGLTDHLILFSTPVTGSYYYVPSMQLLTDVFGPLKADDDEEDTDDSAAASSEPVAEPPTASASGLGIGSLRSWTQSSDLAEEA